MVARRRIAKRAPPKISLRTERQAQREILRERVLDAASAIIAKGGGEALSMRRLAEALDCAPMSLYSHFDDKHGLLLALANRSFEALAVRLGPGKGSKPLDSLRTFFSAYAKFAFAHPDDYRTMFMTPEVQPPQAGKSPQQMVVENPAFAAGIARVSACVDAGAFRGDPHAITTILWTTTHGAISAILTFPAYPFGKPADYVARVLDMTIAALEANVTKAIV